LKAGCDGVKCGGDILRTKAGRRHHCGASFA
jgi:hypothetical protein